MVVMRSAATLPRDLPALHFGTSAIRRSVPKTTYSPLGEYATAVTAGPAAKRCCRGEQQESPEREFATWK